MVVAGSWPPVLSRAETVLRTRNRQAQICSQQMEGSPDISKRGPQDRPGVHHDNRYRPPPLGGARDASQSTQRNTIKTISRTNHEAKQSQPIPTRKT